MIPDDVQRRLVGSLLLLVTLSACTSGPRLGTPQYFELLTGLPLVLREPLAYCRWEAGFDLVGAWVFQFDPAATEPLLAPPDSFWELPNRSLSPDGDKFVSWKHVPPTGIDGASFNLTLSVLDYVGTHDCTALFSAPKTKLDVLRAMSKPTTYFTYEYDELDGARHNIAFYVLDPTEGRIYELIESTGAYVK